MADEPIIYKKIGIYVYRQEDILGSGGFGQVFKGKVVESESVVNLSVKVWKILKNKLAERSHQW